MGSICSKSSVHEGGHTLLGSGAANTAPSTRPNPAPSDPRTAAAQAAERRIQAVSICHHEYLQLLYRIYLQAQRKGVNEANPKAGKLAAQLAKQSTSSAAPQTQREERLVVSEFIQCHRLPAVAHEQHFYPVGLTKYHLSIDTCGAKLPTLEVCVTVQRPLHKVPYRVALAPILFSAFHWKWIGCLALYTFRKHLAVSIRFEALRRIVRSGIRSDGFLSVEQMSKFSSLSDDVLTWPMNKELSSDNAPRILCKIMGDENSKSK